MKTPRHFLSLLDLSSAELQAVIARASELKKLQHAGETHATLQGRVLAMIFEKSSTRTRVSFEAGMSQLGGSAMFLSPSDTQLGRGEPVEDSARVISSMVDCVMIRTFEHEMVETFAKHSRVPVINGLTDLLHPCQLLADMQTFTEHRGSIKGKTVTWVGDGNNMCHSYINAARQFDFNLRIACPAGYEPDEAIVDAAKDRVTLLRDPMEAASGSHLVVTDTWVSMGQEEEKRAREKIFGSFKVSKAMMQEADKDALFMHCLPAYRGMEVDADVLDAPDSVVWDEAENRLHAQKALLEFLLR
ncbi:MAG: ornithine carbamoyltransferase [Sedimenticolaceae bacterium]|jgi:ornithine carbamoyltransferase